MLSLPEKPPRLPALRLLTCALMFSVVLLSCVAAGIILARKTPPPTASLTNLFYILIASVGVIAFGFAALLGPGFVAAVRKRWETRRDQPGASDWLLNQFGSLIILRLALFEGWGLLGAVGLQMTGAWPLLIAPFFSILFMLALMPSEAKVREFIERITGQVPQ